MASIGPQIPPHLLSQSNNASNGGDELDNEDDQGPQPGPSSASAIGPQIPAHLLNSASSSEKKLQVYDEDDNDDGPQPAGAASGPSIGPSLPPEVKRPIGPAMPSSGASPSLRPVAGPSMPPPSSSISGRRPIGPSFPPGIGPSSYQDEDSDDDDIGPKPLPASLQAQQSGQSDAVREFLEREEKRKKAVEEAAKPKALQREEWMLVPPTTAGLLGNLDPTKLKARQFSASSSATTAAAQDSSLWTETPQERQQRLADEVSGKKRRVTDAPPEDEDEKARKRRRKQEEEAIRRGVDEHTRKARGAALVDQHKTAMASKKTDDEEVTAIWDHSRDMGIGGRLMDDDKRNKMLREARGLGDRFGSGSTGGFL